jgi:hypothetical protein
MKHYHLGELICFMPIRLVDSFRVPGSATVSVALVGVSPTDHLAINRIGNIRFSMKSQLLARLTVSLAILGAGCGQARDYSKPVAAAMDARQQAYAKATTSTSDHGRTIITVALADFEAEMRKLDVAECPSDFRDAWTSYLNLLDVRVKREPVLRYVSLGGSSHQWEVSLDVNGMEFRDVWEQLNDAAQKYKRNHSVGGEVIAR